MSDKFDPAEMVQRFRERADAVRRRQLPPVEGEPREDFIRQAKLDHQDFAIIGDADAELTEGTLTLRIDLRPESDRR